MPHRYTQFIRLGCLAIFVGWFAASARAQAPIESAVSHVGVGAGINFYRPSNNDGQSSDGLTIAYRWHSFHSGWGPTFGLDWHTTAFTEPRGSLDLPLGSLRQRTLLAGFGHTRHIKRLSASGSVSVGYSFNDFSVDGAAGAAFARTGPPLVGVSVKDSAMLKPEVSVWYDVFRHAGVGVSAAYLISRPEEVLATTASSTSRHLHADSFALTVGVTFGVWRKRS